MTHFVDKDDAWSRSVINIRVTGERLPSQGLLTDPLGVDLMRHEHAFRPVCIQRTTVHSFLGYRPLSISHADSASSRSPDPMLHASPSFLDCTGSQHHGLLGFPFSLLPVSISQATRLSSFTPPLEVLEPLVAL